jgi:enoyl-CoA hydratase/carnithine racemase
MYLLNRKVSPADAKAMNLVTDVFPADAFMAEVRGTL